MLPVMIKSHFPAVGGKNSETVMQLVRGASRVIHLVRNPWDNIVSRYHGNGVSSLGTTESASTPRQHIRLLVVNITVPESSLCSVALFLLHCGFDDNRGSSKSLGRGTPLSKSCASWAVTRTRRLRNLTTTSPSSWANTSGSTTFVRWHHDIWLSFPSVGKEKDS